MEVCHSCFGACAWTVKISRVEVWKTRHGFSYVPPNIEMWGKGREGRGKVEGVEDRDSKIDKLTGRFKWGKVPVVKQARLLLLTAKPVKTVIMRTFCFRAALFFRILCFSMHKHTLTHSCPFKSPCCLPYLGKKGVSSLWRPSSIQGHSECSWRERSIENTHSLTFHQTHALMQFWLESVAMFVLMSIWRRWGWTFS